LLKLGAGLSRLSSRKGLVTRIFVHLPSTIRITRPYCCNHFAAFIWSGPMQMEPVAAGWRRPIRYSCVF